MKNILKIGLIGLCGVLGVRYYKAYKVAERIKITIKQITINAINKNAFQIGIAFNVANSANYNMTLSKSSLKAYLNGKYAGLCYLPYVQTIQANTTSEIYIVCNIYYKETFKEFWNLLLNFATTAKLTIAGSLNFNGVMLPIPQINIYEFSLKDTIQAIKTTDNISGISGRSWYGGNRGYYGYSKSVRAVDAEDRGLRNVSQMDSSFLKEINDVLSSYGKKTTLAQIKSDIKNGDIIADEWHHTSKYGNKTNYYSFENIVYHYLNEDEIARYEDEQQKKSHYDYEILKNRKDWRDYERKEFEKSCERIWGLILNDKYEYKASNGVVLKFRGKYRIPKDGIWDDDGEIFYSKFNDLSYYFSIYPNTTEGRDKFHVAIKEMINDYLAFYNYVYR